MTDPSKVVAHVAGRFGLAADTLLGTVRTQQVSWTRHVCYRVLQEVCSMSSTGIGQMFSRDHTTVLSGLRMVAEREEHEPWVEQMLKDLIAECQCSCRGLVHKNTCPLWVLPV